MSAFVVLPPGDRVRRAARVVPILLALLLLAGVSPSVAGSAVQRDSIENAGVELSIDGLDGVVVGVPSPVAVTVRVREQRSLRATTPLRLVGTVTGGAPEGLAVALVDGDEHDELHVDGGGRFVFPREDRAPLSLATTPALASARGYTATLLLTVPDRDERSLTVQLALSNERSAQVVRRFGSERVGTAADISANTFNPGVAVTYVARADEFPDALTGGPAAGLSGSPILLTYPDDLPGRTIAELRRLRPGRIAVLGGRAAISDAVLAQLGRLSPGGATRVFGSDRFATAAAIALDRYDGPIDTLYVATGTVFADALAGGPAAAKADAPLLLVTRDQIPAVTLRAIRSLAPRRIVVLGGSMAISDAVVGRLAGLADDGATRHYGRDRFETSAAISRRSFAPDDVHTVYLATGMNFPDSLAGAPAAVLDGAPMLLVTRDRIPPRVRDEIVRLRPAVVVLLGGTAVVGRAVADEVARLTQDVGPDRSRFVLIGSAAGGAFTPILGDPCDTATTFGAAPAEQPLFGTFAAGNPRSAEARARVTAERGDGAVAALGSPAPTEPLLVASSADPSVSLDAPTTAAPALLRLRGRFSATFTSPPGTYAFDYRSGDGDWEPFINPTATGETPGGAQTVRLNAPIDPGVYDVRVTVATADGTFSSEQADALDVRMFVGGTPPPLGPPPIITPLVEGVSNQPQVFSVPPAGGLAYDPEEGTRLKVLLTRAERSHVDYPLDAEVEVISEEGRPLGGTAELFVVRDQWAEIVYEMHPDDQPAGATPTRYTFRIEGVDVADVHESVIGGFFRTDIWHGVNIVFPVGEGAPVSSPEIADLRADRFWEEQHVSFGVHPALSAGATVTVDLSEAVDGGVDYSDAEPFFVGDGHGEPVDMPGTVAFNDDRTALVVTAGDGGWPTIQPPAEGPIPAILIEGVTTPDIEATFTVPFRRSDLPGAGTTTFSVAPAGDLVDVEASDLACGEEDQTQIFGATLVRDLPEWSPIYISLGGAQRGGADYRDAQVAVTSGSGEGWVWAGEEFGEAFAYVEYLPGADDRDGDRIELEVSGVHTDPVHESHLASFYRDDAETGRSTVFDIGAGSAFVSPVVSDLEADVDWTWQSVSLALREDLPAGETITVDLSSAEQGGASYGQAMVFAWDGGFDAPDVGDASLDVVDGESAIVTYTAGSGGLEAGVSLYLDIEGISTDAVTEEHTARFERGDGGVAASAFRIRTFPSLRDASITDLAKATAGQQQTITATVVGDMEPFTGVEIDLSSAAAGGADYTGASATVLSGNGDATVFAFDDGDFSWASVFFEAGPDGIASGEQIRIRLDGVETDDVDETHVAWLYRYDGFSVTSAVFDIGEGGVFVGAPFASDVFQAGPGDIRQFFAFSPARDLEEGDTITIDLSSAQQGVVDYSGGAPDLWSGSGEVALQTTATSALLTYTAPPGGVAAGDLIGAHIHQLAATPTADRYEAVFTHTPSGRAATAAFGVDFDGHFFGAAAAQQAGEELRAAGRAPRVIRPDGSAVRR